MERLHPWPNACRAAVSLTYDDGLPNHYQYVAPLLEAGGLRATFYTPLNSDVMQHPLEWRALAESGHEIGNHGVFHPCWSPDGRLSDWLADAFNLAYYDAERWLEEMSTANAVLKLIDGKKERTFGNTCFDNVIGPLEKPQSLEPLIEKIFTAARGVETHGPVGMKQINFNNLGSVWADRRSFEDFSTEIEEILDTGGWIIYTFHGVGPEAHHLHIDQVQHEKLVEFLREQAGRIWTAPLIEVAQYLKAH